MSDYLDANNEELLKDFFAEAEQQVETLESNILVIENDPSNHEAIDEIFRAAHTLKGGSATVEMTELSSFCHDVEDLLDALRGGAIGVSEPIVDVLLSAIDVIKAMLETRSGGAVYQEDVSPLVGKIKSFLPEKSGKKKAPVQMPKGMVSPKPAPVSAPVSQPSSSMPPVPPLSDADLEEIKEACPEGHKIWVVNVTFDESNPMNSVGGIQVFAALKNRGVVLKTVPDFEVLYEDEFHSQVVYYVATTCGQNELEDICFLDDVTLATDAHMLSSSSSSPAPAPKAESRKAPEPVVQNPEPEEIEVPEHQDTSSAVPATTANVQQAKKTVAPAHATQTGSILRVDSKRVDNLMNLVSETVITKAVFNQTGLQLADLQLKLQNLNAVYKERQHHIAETLPKLIEEVNNGATTKDIRQAVNEELGGLSGWFDGFENEFKTTASKFRSSTQNLGRIASELQEGVMKIRMVPIGTIFNRFPRVVRDLSRDLGRKVELIIEGEETELDKTVVDDLLDPIMHCVRNSVDHGIEKPEDRRKLGKDETGKLILKASNEGNMIVIDIIDDGQGIEVDKVREKAIKKGLISPNKILSDQEAYNLIFLPGFSTSDKISNVSGRGVGLDVVKTMVEKLKGTITITSERNKGSRFSIRLPLTLAIIQGLLIRVGKEVYSVPIANVIESQRVKRDSINTIDNYEVLNVRNEVISILRLSRLFNIRNSDQSDYCFIVIVGSQEKKIGVMVDALVGEEDVVIKPLRDQFTTSPGIAGASILGDGSVSLIIDVSQLLELGVKQEISAQQTREEEAIRNARG
ncbi:MAG: chemotaxis protein CheA [Treponema sp.]|nr:chemotaxis protein CheA [Treponema sp.]MBQ2552569.1 chemotaxis protein CheA [Treponema sp.]MBQ4235756.1 chemotaxis protein CheA [Treponema sp.]